jgi:Ca2+-binding RTX toxin-like protein
VAQGLGDPGQDPCPTDHFPDNERGPRTNPGASSLRSGRDDSLTGDNQNDKLYGGQGDDDLSGGDGNDWLKSRDHVSGNDTVDGDTNTDTCVIDAGDSVTSCER